MALFGNSVLIRKDRLGGISVGELGQAVGARGGGFVVFVDFGQLGDGGGVDCGDYGEVVLEFVEVGGGGCEGVV